MKRARNQAGFTLLELLITTSIIGVIALVMSDFYANRLVDYNRNFTLISLQANTKQAIATMERDTLSAQAIEDSNAWPDSNSPGAPGNLNSWASTAAVLVLATPVLDTSGNLIFADSSHNSLDTNDTIYYVNSSGVLYRRTVANTVSGNAAVTTCPPASATPSCPADSKIIENVASLSVAYLDTANNAVTPASASTSIQITLQQSSTVFGHTYISKLTSQASLRNK